MPAQPELSGPDSTAVRVALWRALHALADPPPRVFEDTVGLSLAAPDEGWRKRPDMGAFTRPFRASIVARTRFVEDLVEERAARGVAQEWKRRRLIELGYGVPASLRLVPVDFEAGEDWGQKVAAAGFDAARPAVLASTGVSMYLTEAAVAATLRQVAAFAAGSTLVMSFMLPVEMLDPDVRPGVERAVAGARASGTPFISFFKPEEMLALAREAGFRNVRHVSAESLGQRYFAGRTDGLRPPRNSEELLVAAA